MRDDGRLPDFCYPPALRINHCELRGRVIIPQLFVVRTGEQVFKRRNWRGLAIALLHNRTIGNCRLRRWFATFGGNHLHQQRVAVGHPLKRRAVGGIYSHAGNPARHSRRCIGHPQLSRVRGKAHERDALPIRRPHWRIDVSASRQCELLLFARGDVENAQAGDVQRMVRPVRRRIDAMAGQSQHRLRQISNRGMPLAFDDQQAITRWADHHNRRRRRLQHVCNYFGWLLIASRVRRGGAIIRSVDCPQLRRKQ